MSFVVSIAQPLHARGRNLIIDLFFTLLLISIALAVGWPRYRTDISWDDEGLLAYGAARVMEGQMPQRDFFSPQPPLSFYVAAFIFKILGTSLASLRVLGLFIQILIPLLLFGIARCLFMSSAVALSAALPATVLGISIFHFVPYPVWQGITVTLAAALIYLSALRLRRPILAMPAGALTAVSIFLRHDQGIYFALAILISSPAAFYASAMTEPRRILKSAVLFWLFGLSAMALLLMIWWWWHGALPEMVNQLVIFPFSTYRKTSGEPFPHFGVHQTAHQNSLTLLYYLPPAVIALAMLWISRQFLRRNFGSRETALLFLSAWSGLFYCQVGTRSDLPHLVITLAPFFLLAAFGWQIFLEILGPDKALITSVSILTAIAIGCYLRAIDRFPPQSVSRDFETLELPRGGVRIQNAAWTKDFIEHLREYVPPERSILVLPYRPMYYFLSERRNPTRWNYLWPGDQSRQDHEQLIEQLQKDPPAIVFIINEAEMRSYAQAILDYVHRDYRLDSDLGVCAVYVPRD